jgi:hypothetical protein
MSDDRGQMTVIRGQMSEVRLQISEIKRQREKYTDVLFILSSIF